jgi:hypothetical protein
MNACGVPPKKQQCIRMEKDIKEGEQEGKTGFVWGLGPVGGGRR